MNMSTFEVLTEITPERIASVLCSGFEGGSYGVGYWLRIMEYRDPETKPTKSILGQRYTDFPLQGGAVVCRLYDEPGQTDEHYDPLVLDYAAIQRGLKVMSEKFPRHFADLVNEDDDATTGDVFIQCCLLGNVVYG